jgi:hypothetical protein
VDVGAVLWVVLKFGGPVILLAVLGWAIWRNKQSRIPERVTEAGTRRVYDEEERARRAGTDGED